MCTYMCPCMCIRVPACALHTQVLGRLAFLPSYEVFLHVIVLSIKFVLPCLSLLCTNVHQEHKNSPSSSFLATPPVQQAYEKRLASLPKTQSAADAARSTDAMGYGTLAAVSSFSSSGANAGLQDSAAALDRMANELASKAERNKKFSRRRTELDGADVDHINSRNAHFNKKIKRAYDKYTIEIKQDLERGTAL